MMGDKDVRIKIDRVIRGVRFSIEMWFPVAQIIINEAGKETRIFTVDEFKKMINEINIDDSMFAIIYNDILDISEKLNEVMTKA